MSITALSSFRRDRNGNVALVFAFAALALMGAMGGAVDYVWATAQKTSLQTAVDAAALAGVMDTPDTRDETAIAMLRADMRGELAAAVRSDFRTNADDSYTASAEADVATFLLPVVGIRSIPIKVSATAKAGTPSPVCILLVSPNASQSLLVNGGAAINAPDCEIHVRSTANPAAILNGGTTLNVKRVCVEGRNVIRNGGAQAPLETECQTATDPFTSLPAPPADPCTHTNKTFDPASGTRTLDPGVYCGWTNFNGSQKIVFRPGVYVIRGGGMIINGNSTVEGDGVTFYFESQNASLTLNGSPTVSLKAPASGAYAGILMYEPRGLPRSQFIFNGSVRTDFDGLIYLPSRDVIFNATSHVSAERLTMVFNTLTLNATKWSFKPADRRISSNATSGGDVRLVR